MKVRHNLIKASAIVVLLAASASAFSSHVWNNYHWGTTVYPIPLHVVDSISSNWQFELNTTISEWNQSSRFNMAISAADDSDRTRKRCSMSSGEIRVCNASYGFNGWLGLASINISGGHITQGTAKMNDSYSSYWANPDEKRHVMCQEVGHLFGLGHTSEDGSTQHTCMDYSSDPTSILPNAHDYATLEDIYAHTDSSNTWAGASSPPAPCKGKNCPKGAAGLDSDVPLGILVSSSKREEIWVASDNRGGYWVTHIRLVPDEWKNPSLHN